MSSPWSRAGELLERHYRWVEIPEPNGSWRQAAALLLDQSGKQSGKKLVESPEWEQTCLGTSEELVATGVSELREHFEHLKLPEKALASLLGLANWWLTYVTDADPLLERIGDESLRESLHQVKGLSGEQADRLVLFVFGRTLLPLNRTTIRVGCRHRWTSWEGDDEEWQGWFRQVLRDQDYSPQELAGWLIQVGKDYCAPQPKCAVCPLQPLLPPSGPDEPLE